MSDTPSTDYLDMVDTLTRAGLASPPVPPSLRAAIRGQGKWMWTSRPSVLPHEMYFFQKYSDETLTKPVDDFVALSHAGHGTNSYGLNFHLVYGPLALFTQDAWGGTYMDTAQTTESIAATFEHCRRLVDGLEGAVEGRDAQTSSRIVLRWSGIRGYGEYIFADALARDAESAEWISSGTQAELFSAASLLLASLAR